MVTGWSPRRLRDASCSFFTSIAAIADKRIVGIRRFRVVLTGLLVILFGAASAVAEDYLQMTLWRELEPMYEPGVEYPVPGDEVARRLLAEARLVVSAMVYGVRFDYVPQDTARGLAGSFSIEPNASIPWGDQALITADAWSSLGRRNITFRYWLGYDQASRRRAWSSNAVPVAAGTGSAEP